MGLPLSCSSRRRSLRGKTLYSAGRDCSSEPGCSFSPWVCTSAAHRRGRPCSASGSPCAQASWRERGRMMPYDVLIIGAGAAGLTAAAELARAHVSALVVDARERIGGRIWSHQEPGLPVPVEFGAEFIHGYAAATFALLAKATAAAVDTGDTHWWRRAGTLAPVDALLAEIRTA